MSYFAPRFLFATVLALPLVAQDEPQKPAKAPTVAAASGPMLVVKTTTEDVAMGASMMFASEEGAGEMPQLPKLEAGQHWVISVGTDKKVAISTGKGDVGYLSATVKPGLMMSAFEEQIGETMQMMQGMATMGLQQAGIKAADAVKMIKAVLDFPKQVDSLDLKVVGDPEKASSEGMDIDLSLQPVKDTWFARFAAAMQPNQAGAPMVEGDAPIRVAAALDTKGMSAFYDVYADFAAGIGAKKPEDKAKAAEMIRKSSQLMDGTFGMTMTLGTGMRFLMGVSDGAAMAQLVASDDYMAFQKAATSANPMMEVEMTPKAMEHRGVAVTKVSTKFKDESMAAMGGPMAMTGDMFTGVAGNYVFSIMGAEQDAKGMIDSALDSKVKRAPLPGGALMTVKANLKEMAGAMGGDEDVPENLEISLTRKGDGLNLKIRAK